MFGCRQAWRSPFLHHFGFLMNVHRTLLPRVAAVVLFFSLAFSACDSTVEPVSSSPPTATSGDIAFAQVNSAMDELGQFIAYSLPSRAFRQLIEAEATQRFDGDANVLLGTLLSKRLGSEEVRRAIAARYATATGTPPERALRRLNALASGTARLHLGVFGLNEWDASNFEPRVAVEPLGVQDTEVTQVKAYSSDGSFVWLDAQADPDFPVLYVGINERTDDAGNVSPDYREPAPCEDQSDLRCGGGGGGGTGSGGTGGGTGGSSASVREGPSHSETLYEVTIRDDNEPWWKGKAEIKLQANGVTSPTVFLYRGDLNKGEGTHTIDRRLFFWNPSNMGFFYGIRWWEEDIGATVSFNVSLSGKITKNTTATVGFTFSWKDNDDDMGAVAINFDDPLQAYYDTGDVEWNMK